MILGVEGGFFGIKFARNSKNSEIGVGKRLINDFKKPPEGFKEDLKGGHLRPLGIQFGNYVINFPDLKDGIPLIESIQKRNTQFESPVSQLFQRLEDKQTKYSKSKSKQQR